LHTVLHKQTHGSSPPPLLTSEAVLFILRSSVLLELPLVDSDEVELDCDDVELEVEVEVELELLELCFDSYSFRSSLRFCSH
jgi:hypothetical protein